MDFHANHAVLPFAVHRRRVGRGVDFTEITIPNGTNIVEMILQHRYGILS